MAQLHLQAASIPGRADMGLRFEIQLWLPPVSQVVSLRLSWRMGSRELAKASRRKSQL